MKTIVDIFGMLLLVAAFATPSIAIPIARIKGINKFWKIVVSIMAMVVLSVLLFGGAVAILFRDGLGFDIKG